jgi:hypothetical protein
MTSLPLGLSINQRNIYHYFLAHQKRNKHAPCFVPKIPTTASRIDDYLNALVALERKGLIIVDRSAQHYTGWIMRHGKSNYEEKQQGLTPAWK